MISMIQYCIQLYNLVQQHNPHLKLQHCAQLTQNYKLQFEANRSKWLTRRCHSDINSISLYIYQSPHTLLLKCNIYHYKIWQHDSTHSCEFFIFLLRGTYPLIYASISFVHNVPYNKSQLCQKVLIKVEITFGYSSSSQPGPDQALTLLQADDSHFGKLGHVRV